MAVLVSHAMHRFPTSPSDAVYSSYALRGESSRGESALSRSMRYADPWLYGTVRATSGAGLFLAPALVLCTCQDYVNGTKRSSKKSPSTCKKCKGTRLPLSAVDSKFGTVRCYPTTPPTAALSTPLRAGTVRVSSSSSRPSILPPSAAAAAADPYDLMRRSRLAVAADGSAPVGNHQLQQQQQQQSQLRRSVSPGKVRVSTGGEQNKAKDTKKKEVSYNSTFGRRSILECDINPYELISSETPQTESKNSSITLVNGQRIRVRPQLDEYEDVQIRQTKPLQSPKSPTSPTTPTKGPAGAKTSTPTPSKISISSKSASKLPERSPVIKNKQANSSKQSNEIETDNSSPYDTNRFKSILKKRPSAFDTADPVSPKPASPLTSKSGSQFYVPTPRKKVQFLMENDEQLEECEEQPREQVEEVNREVVDEEDEEDDVFEDALEEPSTVEEESVKIEESCKENSTSFIPKLQRSFSERINNEQMKVVFHDTMALRQKKRKDSRSTFGEKDLERLDGITRITRKLSLDKPRPVSPPPLPPQIQLSDQNTLIDANCLKAVTKESESKLLTKHETNHEVINENIIDSKTDSSSINDVIPECTSDIKILNVEEKGNSFNYPPEINDISDTQKEYKALEKLDECLNNPTIVLEPPTVPPRKRSNNRQPTLNNILKSPETQTIKIESPSFENNSNKTIVQINGSMTAVHKLQIKNEFTDTINVQTVSVLESPQRKTSILINGDDCYSTVNVNDDVPLYQSSVVVKDNNVEVVSTAKRSLVYITGSFSQPERSISPVPNSKTNVETSPIEFIIPDIKETIKPVTKDPINDSPAPLHNALTPPSSDVLKELLRDPVEAVRRNLVPHVCGKSDVSRRPRNNKSHTTSFVESSLDDNNITTSSLEESFLRLRSYESVGDDISSEHSSSTQYELMDMGSDCYTDHSNRSSVTEEELANRTKFYELLADAAHVEVSENEDHHYESIKTNTDPIYEEIEMPPPLPTNPPPSCLLDDLQLDKEYTTRSIFEGASKYDILSYLVDAKERGIVQEDGYAYSSFNSNSVQTDEETKEPYNRPCHLSTVSDSSEDNSLIISGALIDDKATFQKPAEVERNDSGVGSETSKSSLSKYRTKQEISISCEDCDSVLEYKTENEPLICRKCLKRRTERKEIITEIVETEEKYSKDLQIILEEFYQPMLVAGLLTPDQLSAIFLNSEELLENSHALAERLRDAVEIALEQGDDDLLTVNIGKLFLEAAPMLHAFESYCVRQGAASLLLASLEKDKELLRIFLRVSQMENTLLRRMNLNSFLMVPVQRVTKYPLLLARLYKVSPVHHETREQLKEAQHKIELHLNHMNSETKDVPSKLWRRIGSSSGRRASTEMDLVNIKLRKIAVDVLEWNHEEAKFALEGKLLYTQPTDNNWRKGRTIKLSPINALLVINGKPINNKPVERTEENGLVFSRHSGIREAALLLVRDKNGRYSLLREPLYLDRCVVAADPAWQSYFEVQELLGKDTFIFKADDEEQTQIWYKQIQHHAQGLGAWRKRRNALANIMINGMGLRT